MTLNLIIIFNSITDISFLRYVTKIFCISYYFQQKFSEFFKVHLSVTVSVYILTNVFLATDFWKYAEVLVQHLKNLFWKIIPYHIIQLIKITPIFCKLFSLYIHIYAYTYIYIYVCVCVCVYACVLCVWYKPKS